LQFKVAPVLDFGGSTMSNPNTSKVVSSNQGDDILQIKVDLLLVYSAGKAFSLCSGGIVATILLIGLAAARSTSLKEGLCS
jgi:hypothetical protein